MNKKSSVNNSTNYAIKKLWKEFKDINENGELPFTSGLEGDENIFHWIVMIEGPESTIYEGGLFQAKLDFPANYPNMPPKMVFLTKMWHPNIYKNGKVCISILHPPEVDHLNELETLDEKWRPVLGVKEIILSVLSMLTSPNLDSPANVDAAIQYRDSYKSFKKKTRILMDSQ